MRISALAAIALAAIAQPSWAQQVFTSPYDQFDGYASLDYYQIYTRVQGATLTFYNNPGTPYATTWQPYTGPQLSGYFGVANTDAYGGKDLVYIKYGGYSGGVVTVFDDSRKWTRNYAVSSPIWNYANPYGTDTNGNGIPKPLVCYMPYQVLGARPPASCVIVDDVLRTTRTYSMPNMPIQAPTIAPAGWHPGNLLIFYYYDGTTLKHCAIDDYYRTVWYW